MTQDPHKRSRRPIGQAPQQASTQVQRPVVSARHAPVTPTVNPQQPPFEQLPYEQTPSGRLEKRRQKEALRQERKQSFARGRSNPHAAYRYEYDEGEYFAPEPPPSAARPRRGCLKVFLALAVFAIAGVVVALFLLHQAASQVVDDSEMGALADNPAVGSVLDRHDLSMWDLLVLSREMEGASQQEVLDGAREMGLTEQDMQELLSDNEVRGFINQFLNR